MVVWETILKEARECHTKQAWDTLFLTYEEQLASTNHSKIIQDLFKLLKADPQSLQYSHLNWEILLKACLSSWNLELGRTIAHFTRKLTSPATALQAAKIWQESGYSSVARAYATRALRLSALTPSDKILLEMLICTSYAEEGKREKAVKVLNRISITIKTVPLDDLERANFLLSVGRMEFLLGRYLQAADSFHEAASLYKKTERWEESATALHNTAVSKLNSGGKEIHNGFALLEECKRLAEAKNLPGHISFCETAYGIEAYYQGDLPSAREHLRSALDHLPPSDKGPRRQHILSMLALTYLTMGRFHHAKRFGQQTLDLVALNESKRFETRWVRLQAQLLWIDGCISESQQILQEVVQDLETKGVHVLEELTTLSRYHQQSAMLGHSHVPDKLAVDEDLKKHAYSWLEHLFSLGLLNLNGNHFSKAEQLFTECIEISRLHSNRYHDALGQLGILQCKLKQQDVHTTKTKLRDFEIAAAKLGDTPLKVQIPLIHAAIFYHEGEFEECKRMLRQAAKVSRQNFEDKVVISACLASIEGKSAKISDAHQKQLIARFVQTYFGPTLEVIDERNFRVNNHYIINLERNPSLANLLNFLISKPNYTASAAEIQTEVWNQSINLQGWQQKIRNTIMRLRDSFPYTIAPLIIHQDDIALFSEAIHIKPLRKALVQADKEILSLLKTAPMSSSQLSKQLSVSSATTKRVLKKLTETEQIFPVKSGRNVLYTVHQPSQEL